MSTTPRKRGRPSRRDKYGTGVHPGTTIRRHDAPRSFADGPRSFAETGGHFGRNDFKAADQGATR